MSDNNQTMSDKDPAVVLSLNGSNDRPERLWAHDDFTAVEDQPADFATGLVSLGFIRAAIRRSGRFWRLAAVIGLLCGFGLYARPPRPTRPRRRS